MGQSLRDLREGPDDCPICEGPCQGHFERGEYVLGGDPTLHPDHPDNPKNRPKEVEPVKRPHGKRRPAEDRARHAGENR